MTANPFKTLVETTDDFIITCEHIPGRLSKDKKLDEILSFAEQCTSSGIVHALSLTDNPGGTPALSPDILAAEIEKLGLPVLVHFTAKDMNRNMMESRALALGRLGVRNLLIMSGDFQTIGQAGLPMPVFDLDPIHMLGMINLMNEGLAVNQNTRETEPFPQTDFYTGACVSPFKFTEPGAMLQYYKMEKKIRAGARYLITQLGFDAKKLMDLKRYMEEQGLDTPLFGSVFILRRGAATVMNRGDIPGSFVTDALLHEIQNEATADDKGRAASLERAAMQVAVLKGLGFRGAHIEAMILRFDMVETILGRAEELAQSWEECAEKLAYAPGGSWYMGTTKSSARSSASKKLKKGWITYLCMRVLHKVAFMKTGLTSGVMRGICTLLDRVPAFGAIGHFTEKYTKELLFDCRDCGDCALPELQFLCPQSQCPKQERNAPCGGSRLDACEVYPDRPCVWNRVYTRAKAFNELEELRTFIVGPRDWALRNTSGWVNFHLNRDHTSYDFAAMFDAEAAE